MFAVLIRVEGYTSAGHHTYERRIRTIGQLVDAVQTPIKIQEKTLKPGEDRSWILVWPHLGVLWKDRVHGFANA